jgi:hypothetical protein
MPDTISRSTDRLLCRDRSSPYLLLFVAFSMVALLAGCATVGKDFPAGQVTAIQIGKTTREEVREVFGAPWRTGIEDGRRTWTYGKYKYSLFAPARTQDLVIRFNDEGKVVSYTFNTTEHQE